VGWILTFIGVIPKGGHANMETSRSQPAFQTLTPIMSRCTGGNKLANKRHVTVVQANSDGNFAKRLMPVFSRLQNTSEPPPSILAMKLAIALFAFSFSIFANPPDPTLTPIFDPVELQFKASYHRWAAAIYDNPRILLSSIYQPYIELPEYQEIIKLGRPAIPYIVAEMMREDSEFGIDLRYAIIEILGKKLSDFPRSGGAKENNLALVKQLEAEGILAPGPRPNPAPKEAKSGDQK